MAKRLATHHQTGAHTVLQVLQVHTANKLVDKLAQSTGTARGTAVEQ